MPLHKGKSEKAFSENVRTEMHHGKPQKQALAIAYRMQRKKAKGGGCVLGRAAQVVLPAAEDMPMAEM